MNWTEKAKEIAEEILKEGNGNNRDNYTRDEVLKLLRKAAYSGMEFECDNWFLKRR